MTFLQLNQELNKIENPTKYDNVVALAVSTFLFSDYNYGKERILRLMGIIPDCTAKQIVLKELKGE